MNVRWMRSLRFRLALRWSAVLTLIAAVVLVGLNVALAQAVGDAPSDARTFRAVQKERTEGGGYRFVRELELGDVQEVEAVTNARTLRLLRTYSGVAVGGLFATSLLVGWVLAGRALRPVRRLTVDTTAVDGRDLSRRMSVHGDDELGSLARSIDEMLARLDETFGRQRRFVDDASHELRTPLAVIRANVDAVLSRPDVDSAERERAVATTRRAVERMTGLVDDLLASARASAPEEMRDVLRLDQLAREELEEFAVLAETRGVELLAHTTPTTAQVHETAVRRAVDNVLGNAVRLTSAGTQVRLDVGAHGDWAFVAVTDRGPGLSEQDAEQVFDRFWRADGQATHDGHSGLGLSIVRQVVESHGGTVRVHSTVGYGATFVLWFPLAPDLLSRSAPPLASPVTAASATRASRT